MDPDEIKKKIEHIKNSLSSNKADDKKTFSKKETAVGIWEKTREAKRNMIEAREKFYRLFAKVIEKLRGDGIFLKLLRIDMNYTFVQVVFEDESLKDFKLRDESKRRLKLSISRNVLEGTPLPWEDPLRQGPSEKELVNNLHSAIKGEYKKWYERLMLEEGLAIGNPISVLMDACTMLLKRKNIQIIPKQLTQERYDMPNYYNVGAGSYIQRPMEYILELDMMASMCGRAEVKMLLKQEDFALKPTRIDELAGIGDSIVGVNRVKLRLAFHLFKAWKRAIHNETDVRGKDLGDSLDRVLSVRIIY